MNTKNDEGTNLGDQQMSAQLDRAHGRTSPTMRACGLFLLEGGISGQSDIFIFFTF
jgi:hypothetical protein